MYQIKNKGLTEANSETFHTVPKELMGKNSFWFYVWNIFGLC